jgi:hypothetical protein
VGLPNHLLGNPMNAPTRIMLAVFITICLVAVVMGVVIAVRAPPRAPVVSCTRAVAAATFTLSNSTSKLVSGWCEAPQIHLHGSWKTWGDSPYVEESFYLWPGAMTNLTVPIPQPGMCVRIPFAWGYDKSSAMQRIAPRFHTRLSNLRSTLWNSHSLCGWSDPYGYLPDERRFYYLTNAEPAD